MAANFSEEGAVEDFALGVLAGFEDVGVDFGGGADGGVTEALGDELEVFPHFEEHGSVGVAERVEAEARREVVAAVFVDGADVGLGEGAAVDAAADAAAVAIVAAVAETVLRLLGAGSFEDAQERGADGDGARAGLGLGTVFEGAVLEEGLVDREGAGGGVEVVPSKGEDFAAARAGMVGDEDGEEELGALALEVVGELVKFFGGESAALTERLSFGGLDTAHGGVGEVFGKDGIVEGTLEDGADDAEDGGAADFGFLVEKGLEVAGANTRKETLTEGGEDVVAEGTVVIATGHGAGSFEGGGFPFARELLVGDLGGGAEAAGRGVLCEGGGEGGLRFGFGAATGALDAFAVFARADFDGVVPFLAAFA